MADYTVAVSWSGKDALADSDANKVISGDDFNTEFTTVQTSVNSKADTASPTLTGTPAAPTAAVGTDTTQLATTAFVKDVLQNYIYPVGSIYMNANVSTNPGTLLGFGTWAAYAAGRVPVGIAGSGTFDTLDKTGGAETDAHELTTAETPAHTHSMGTQVSFNVSIDDRQVTVLDPFWSGFGGGSARATGSAGSGNAHTHDIVQPYVVVHMWERTA
jgi:hypothetical protein